MIISSIKSLFYPFITTINDVSNLKLSYLYRVVTFSLLICILFIKKERLLIKFAILLSFALFYGVTLYALPNLGTFIRYKVTFLPLLLLFSYGELNLFLQKKKSFDINKKLFTFLLTRKFKIYLFLILATLSFLIRDFIFISKSVLKSNQEYLILSLTFISFLFNIFNTVFIDLKNNKKQYFLFFINFCYWINLYITNK